MTRIFPFTLQRKSECHTRKVLQSHTKFLIKKIKEKPLDTHLVCTYDKHKQTGGKNPICQIIKPIDLSLYTALDVIMIGHQELKISVDVLPANPSSGTNLD